MIRAGLPELPLGRLAGICVCVAVVTLAGSASCSQGTPVGAAPRAPIGHRQPAIRDLPPDVGRGREQPADVSRGEQKPESVPSRAQSRGRAGGPPTLEVGPSCEAAGRGSVVLGRDKKACLADETAGHAEAKLVQIRRDRQDRMHRYGDNRGPGQLCRAVVLRRDLAGRPQHPQCRCARERPKRFADKLRRFPCSCKGIRCSSQNNSLLPFLGNLNGSH